MHASNYHGIGIDIIRIVLAPADGVIVSSVLVAQQAMMITMISLFSRTSVCFSVCLRMHQNVPQNTQNLLAEHAPKPPDSKRLQGDQLM